MKPCRLCETLGAEQVTQLDALLEAARGRKQVKYSAAIGYLREEAGINEPTRTLQMRLLAHRGHAAPPRRGAGPCPRHWACSDPQLGRVPEDAEGHVSFGVRMDFERKAVVRKIEACGEAGKVGLGFGDVAQMPVPVNRRRGRLLENVQECHTRAATAGELQRSGEHGLGQVGAVQRDEEVAIHLSPRRESAPAGTR